MRTTCISAVKMAARSPHAEGTGVSLQDLGIRRWWTMDHAITFRPIQVNALVDDGQGQLVLANDRLVAVLVRLTDAAHGSERLHWFLEAGFGPCNTTVPPAFRDLKAAETWIRRRLEAGDAEVRYPEGSNL